MELRKILFIGLLAVTAVSSSPFEQNPGGEADAFTSWGLGVRAEGMGRAFGPLADDASAAYWNPAGLYQLEKSEVTFSSSTPFRSVGDIYYHTFNTALSTAHYVDEDEIRSFGTFDVALAVGTVGGLWESNEKGLTGRRFSDTDIAFYLAYAHSIGKNGGFGFAMKNINRRIEDHSDNGFGLDLGGLYRPFDMLSVSLVIQNLVAPNFEFEAVRESPPITFEIGSAASIGSYGKGAVVAELTREMYYDVYLGGEATPIPQIALRGGWSLGDGKPRVGAGFKFLDFDFNYALRLDGTLGDTHMASVSFYFGGPKERPEGWDEEITEEELIEEEGYIEFDDEEDESIEETEEPEETEE
ncbi:MAG: hypothetical protein JSW52_01735 [Candidatus Coatesbacteria bacterium]|nr:MAG: hypothetical protein JSW52_01735 [Candidatus Coatesbacteria bacterium]